jgi:hypothetical protein
MPTDTTITWAVSYEAVSIGLQKKEEWRLAKVIEHRTGRFKVKRSVFEGFNRTWDLPELEGFKTAKAAKAAAEEWLTEEPTP